MTPIGHLGPGWIDRPWWDGLAWLLPLIFFAVLTGLAIWAVMRVTRQEALVTASVPPMASPGRHPDGAVEQARLRYARGDIARDEYVQIAQDLGGPAAPPEVTPGG